MSENVFEYAMLKSEQTSEIVFIIRVMPFWLEEDMEISYDKDTLNIVLKETIFTSKQLPKKAQDWLKYNPAKIYFANEEGIIISQIMIDTKS